MRYIAKPRQVGNDTFWQVWDSERGRWTNVQSRSGVQIADDAATLNVANQLAEGMGKE